MESDSGAILTAGQGLVGSGGSGVQPFSLAGNLSVVSALSESYYWHINRRVSKVGFPEKASPHASAN
jgi:hypothetical protein